MTPARPSEEFLTIFQAAVRLADAVRVDAILLLLEEPRRLAAAQRVRAAIRKSCCRPTKHRPSPARLKPGFASVILPDAFDTPVPEKLSQALLNAVADDLLASGARVVALYGGFEPHSIDSISLIDLGDHLGRLTVRDLRQLETRVPLDTLANRVEPGGGNRS